MAVVALISAFLQQLQAFKFDHLIKIALSQPTSRRRSPCPWRFWSPECFRSWRKSSAGGPRSARWWSRRSRRCSWWGCSGCRPRRRWEAWHWLEIRVRSGDSCREVHFAGFYWEHQIRYCLSAFSPSQKNISHTWWPWRAWWGLSVRQPQLLSMSSLYSSNLDYYLLPKWFLCFYDSLNKKSQDNELWKPTNFKTHI